jgi:hypothetical protein
MESKGEQIESHILVMHVDGATATKSDEPCWKRRAIAAVGRLLLFNWLTDVVEAVVIQASLPTRSQCCYGKTIGSSKRKTCC